MKRNDDGNVIDIAQYVKDKSLEQRVRTFFPKSFVLLSDGIKEEDLAEYEEYVYEMIYGKGNPILIKADAPLELRKKVLAAALSYSLRLKSVDYVLKKYFAKE